MLDDFKEFFVKFLGWMAIVLIFLLGIAIAGAILLFLIVGLAITVTPWLLFATIPVGVILGGIAGYGVDRSIVTIYDRIE